jgi:hypothetical protein
MRLPRFRFTVRQMMIAVAVTALLLDAAQRCRHFYHCWQLANVAACLRVRGYTCGMAELTPEQKRSIVEYSAKRATCFSRLEAIYRRAAWRPWEAIPPVPPRPE